MAFLVVAISTSFVALFAKSDTAVAAAPSTINFQARLLTAAGAVAPDGQYNVEFKLYTAASGGSAVWTETRTSTDKVRVVNGYMTVNLGSVNTSWSGVDWGTELWMTMNIGGTGSPSWDGEMTPRLKLTAVPYAFQANQAAKLVGGSGPNVTTLDTGTPSGNNTIHLPAESGTLCIQNSANCGFALSNGSGNYIQNQNTAAQSGANFWISGTGRLDTALQSPSIRATTNGTTAIQLQNAAGSSTAMSIDTTNSRVSIGNGGTAFAPQQALDVIGNIQIRDAATPTKAYRLRTSGTALDFEAGGADLYISNWSGGDFTGTQRNYLRLESGANIAHVVGSWQFAMSPSGTTRHTIDGTSGTDVKFNQDGEATDFIIQGDTDANLLFVDGSADKIGIGVAAPGYKLDVNGDINISTGSVYRINGQPICTVAGCVSAPASGSYIQNGTTMQTLANFYIQSASASSVGGIIRGAASQTSSLLQLLDGTSGYTVAQFSNNGYLSLGSDNIVRGGQISFHDTTTGNGFTGMINTPAAFGANRTYTLPDESGTICIQSSASCGFALSSGSGNYIQNGTSAQNANFFVKAATSGSVAGILQANAAGSGDILQLKSGAGNTIGSFSSSGAFVLQNSLDQVNSFVVQDTLNNKVLNVDTDNGRVGVGGVAGFSKFEVIGGDAAIYNNGNNPRLVLGDSTSAGENGYLQWDSTNNYFRIESVGTNGLKINDNYVTIGNIFPDQPLKVANGTTLLFKVQTDGKVAIGNITASEALDVVGNINISSGSSYKINGTAICTASGCTPASGSGNYIQNQFTAAQTTSQFWISGTGRAATALQAPLLDAAAAGVLNIGTTTATSLQVGSNTNNTAVSIDSGTGAISIGTGAQARTINLGTGAAAQTVTVGSQSGASTLTLNSGTGAINIGAGAQARSVNVGTGGAAQTVTVGSTNTTSSLKLDAGTGSIQIGTSASARTTQIATGAAQQTVQIGSTSGASSLTLDSGTGTINLGTGGQARSVNVGTGAAAQTVTVGSTNTTSSLTLDSGTGAINIGTSAAARTTNIATGAAAQAVTLGSTNGASSLLLQAGTGNVTIKTGGSASAFSVQDTAGQYLFNIDSTNGWTVNNGIIHPNNLLENPSFEAAGSFTATGWNFSSAAAINTATTAHHGNKELVYTSNGTLLILSSYKYLEAQPGDQFYAETWYKAAAGTNGTASFSFTYYDKNKSSIGSSSVTNFSTANTSYTLATVTGTAPAGTAYVRLTTGVNATSTTGSWTFDDYLLVRSSQQAPFVFKNNVDSNNAFMIQDTSGETLFNVNTSSARVEIGKASDTTGKMAFYNAASANAVTIQAGNTTSAYTLTLPTALGTTGDCLKDGGSGALQFTACGNVSGTLQAAYTSGLGGTTPEIIVDSTRGGVDIQDVSTPGTSLGTSPLLAVRGQATASTLGPKYFSVQGDGKVAIGNITATEALDVVGNINISSSSSYKINGTTICTSSGCTPAAGSNNYIQNQSAAQQTSSTFWISGVGRSDNALQAPILDAPTAVALNIGSTNATAINLNQNVTLASGKSLTLQGTYAQQPAADGTSIFNIKTFGGNNLFTVDSTNSRIGIALGSTTLPAYSGSAGIEIKGGFRLSGASQAYADNYTTPGGGTVKSLINIVNYDPGQYNQLVAMGVPTGAHVDSRVLSLFDGRTVAHQPTLAVFSVDQNQVGGFSWDGGSTEFRVKNTNASGTIAINVGGTNSLTASSSAVGIGMTPGGTYKLDVAGDVNISSGSSYRINGTAICTSSGCTPAAGSANYIQNQNSIQQASSNFWVSGTGRVDGGVLTNNVTSNSGALILQAATNVISLGGSDTLTANGGFTMQSGTNSSLTVNANGTGTLSLGSNATSGRIINIGATGTQANTSTINIGNSTGAAQTISIGSTNGSGTTTINGGTGGVNLVTNSASAIIVAKSSTNSATAFQVQNTSGTPAINVDTTNMRLGVGTTTPNEKIQIVGGGINIGNTTNANAGSIRWTGSDFEGYNGSSWISLSNNVLTTTPMVSKRKAVSQDIVNSTTFQDDNELFFNIGANETWSLRGTLHAHSPATADFKITVTAPSGATCVFGAGDIEGALSDGNNGCGVSSGTMNGSSGDEVYMVYGTVVNGATPGVVTIRWAQAVGGTGTTATVYAGSTIDAVRVSGASTPIQAFVQGGNSFSAAAVLGTNDAQSLNMETNGVTRLSISSAGNATYTGGSTGVALTVSNSTSTGNILNLQSNTTNVLTVNNNGDVVIDGLADSATAFQIIDGSAQALFVYNTSTGALAMKGTGTNFGGAKIYFGDQQWVYVGEYATGDTDQLALFGNSGIYFGTSSATDVMTLIGTALTLDGDAYVTGQMGIGTANPSEALTVNGNFNVRNSDTPTKAYRFRTSGGSLDFEGGGANLYLSVWSDPAFSATQRTYIIMYSGSSRMDVSSTYTYFNPTTTSGNVIDVNRSTAGTLLGFALAGTIQGSISVSGTTVSYNAFTGSHYALSDQELDRGLLVSMTGNNQRRDPNDYSSEPFYGVEKTAVANDPKVLGSFLGIVDPSKALSMDNPYQVMSVGNGDMWVDDEGGDIQPGDYLISSNIAGYAMKDNGQFAESNIVARASDGVNWSNETAVINGHKVRKISVLFTQFTKLNATALAMGLTTGGIVSNDVTFNGSVLFNNGVTFQNDVSFMGHIKVGDNTAGTVKIPAGQTSVSVTFSSDYAAVPKITTGVSDFISVKVDSKTKHGFTLRLPSAQASDVYVDWTALQTQ